MFNISYYARGRIVHYIIHVIMVAFLIISLFPIGWMLFNSFKDNTEILSGRIPLNRSGNDCIKLEAEGNILFALSADGGVTKLKRADLSKVSYMSVRTAATSFTTDRGSIWISSSEKGLIRVDKKTLKETGRFAYPFHGVDLSKIASTVIASSDNLIWIAVDYKGLDKILEFNKVTGNFTRLIDITSDLSPFSTTSLAASDGILWAGGNKGLLRISLADGKVSETFMLKNGDSYAQISSILPAPDHLVIGTNVGIYEFSKRTLRVTKRISEPSGLISEQVFSLNFAGDKLVIGTGAGLSLYGPATGRFVNIAKLFHPVSNGKKYPEGLVQAEVFSGIIDGGDLFVGTTRGRVSKFNSPTLAFSAAATLKEGYLLARWRNYVDMWKNIDFGVYVRNSVIICGISTIIAMILATLAAYSLSRFNFPGSKSFSMAILATQMIPAIMYLIPIYITFVKITAVTGIPLKGTYWGMILVYSAFFVPFSIWILRGFFAAIPVELEEAARIDGCNPIQVFWYVVLPLAVPGIIATGVYIFLNAWDELMFAWVLTNADTMTIPVGIRNFVGNYQNRFDLMMAAASVATIPVLVLFFMLQKYIVKGLTAGAVKG